MALSTRLQAVHREIAGEPSDATKRALGKKLTRDELIEFYDTASPHEHRTVGGYLWDGKYFHDAEVRGALVNADARRVEANEAFQRRVEAMPFLAEEAAIHLEKLAPGFGHATTKFLLFFHDRTDPRSVRHELLTFDAMKTVVPARQLHGYDAYIAVNEFSGDVRDASAIVRLRAYFADYDFGKEADEGTDMTRRYAEVWEQWVRYPPDLLIHSGNGIHAYYTAAPGEALAKDVAHWCAVEAALVAKLGADPAAKDPCRVLRLAGTLNMKDRENLKYCRIVHARSGMPRVQVKQRLSFELDLTFTVASPTAAVIDAGVSTDSTPRLERILEKLSGHGRKEVTATETRWVRQCPDHDHDDKNPSFIVLLHQDGAIRMLCRSRCSGRKTGEWLSLLGLPHELQDSDAAFRNPKWWYATVAHETSARGNAGFQKIFTTIESRGLKPALLREPFAVWTFFCPRSQTVGALNVVHDETGEVTHFEVEDNDAAPRARMFVNEDGTVQLRCDCSICKAQSDRRKTGVDVPSAQELLLVALGLPSNVGYRGQRVGAGVSSAPSATYTTAPAIARASTNATSSRALPDDARSVRTRALAALLKTRA